MEIKYRYKRCISLSSSELEPHRQTQFRAIPTTHLLLCGGLASLLGIPSPYSKPHLHGVYTDRVNYKSAEDALIVFMIQLEFSADTF